MPNPSEILKSLLFFNIDADLAKANTPRDVINSWLVLLAYSKFVRHHGGCHFVFCFEKWSCYIVTRYTWTFVMFNLAFMINFCLNYERRNLVSCCSHLQWNPYRRPLDRPVQIPKCIFFSKQNTTTTTTGGSKPSKPWGSRAHKL